MNIDYLKNNLDKSLSPYLRQHSNNPIWWQEWNPQSLAEARRTGKNILVSIGYSTCHWCHVMASEAFSNSEIADYLNKNFISIKVDREQRPDIDQYFMSFLVKTTGSGGWPLNAFLTPDAEPIAAFTYIPVQSCYGIPSMMDIIKAVRERGIAAQFSMNEWRTDFKSESFDDAVSMIISGADTQNGGFGKGHKFPQCSTLLFLLSYYERYKNPQIGNHLIKTLNAIMTGGLHDHLQGGFFRYCVDPQWNIPHFEKMLYDQAMLLWTYSWAYSVFKTEDYLDVIRGIIRCLEETFMENNLFISAHDADTNHKEGDTYLWSYDELEKALTKKKFSSLQERYFIAPDGNFEGKIHLTGRNYCKKDNLEKELLTIRKSKPQPFADRKIITSWNALVGIGLIMAYRASGTKELLDKAILLFNNLVEKHLKNSILSHSSLNLINQEQEFLEDISSLMLFATYIEEEKGNCREIISLLKTKLIEYREGDKWIESRNRDFKKVPSSEFDHPLPSSSSMAEMDLLRTSVLFEQNIISSDRKPQHSRDYFNICSFMEEGHWHFIKTPEKIESNSLSINSIQVKSKSYSDCFEGKCSRE
ncbi:MAG TPA: hypothetical protein DD381_10405 [Lentisphaeria bacterium]|nr:MAG: hypothetical protein A2X47_02265 [Lentisphaerae bacterium GWF2_38_69]HBM16737.1 hypothetical protein [Lentisphaeria bacterium]